MSNLMNVPLSEIDKNPFRRTGDYPYVESKIEALQRSYSDVGMWPGVIARRNGNRTEIAFGHHRIEAARRSGMQSAPIIVMDLSDEEMLGYMGRENLEDYNADFLVMLETWEAAVDFARNGRFEIRQPIDLARILGWTFLFKGDGAERMTPTAAACSAAHALIAGGYLGRAEMRGLAVSAARDIVVRAQVRVEQIQRMAHESKRPAAEVEHAKRQIGRAAAHTAQEVRDGDVSNREIRGRVDTNAYRFAAESKRQTPLFEVFGKALVQQIENTLNSDSMAEKLAEIEKAKDMLTMHEDEAVLRKVDFALEELGARAEWWKRKITPSARKIVPISSKGGE